MKLLATRPGCQKTAVKSLVIPEGEGRFESRRRDFHGKYRRLSLAVPEKASQWPSAMAETVARPQGNDGQAASGVTDRRAVVWPDAPASKNA
ncbi:hypothetical protein [Propionivibrio sp.]|uniref:hypothetical protein n=1 Tax=Propionivibrio sp. TaxID=2212460 RepID=UPI003BF2B9EA